MYEAHHEEIWKGLKEAADADGQTLMGYITQSVIKTNKIDNRWAFNRGLVWWYAKRLANAIIEKIDVN